MADFNNGYVAPTFKAQRVLPTNGQLPGDEHRRYRPFNRIGKLTAFQDEQAAFDSGMALKAIVSRLFNSTLDAKAESYCESIGLDIQNAMAEGTGAGGGYLVPAPLAAAIIVVREQVGVARKALQVMPATSDTLTVPKRNAGLTVYSPAEGTAITDSDAGWKQVMCILKKRAVLSYLSSELVDDALISVTDYIATEMAYALALQEDLELVNGTGAGATYFGVTGLLSSLGSAGTSSAASGHNSFSTLTISDFTAAVGKLPSRYHIYGPAWICSPEFYYAAMVNAALAAGGVTSMEVFGGTSNVRQFLGFPVYLTSQMPTATAASTVCALFGSFSQAGILADRGGIRLARSDEYRFANDQTAMRATTRYDIKIHDSGDSSAAGAYVGLKTAS